VVFLALAPTHGNDKHLELAVEENGEGGVLGAVCAASQPVILKVSALVYLLHEDSILIHENSIVLHGDKVEAFGNLDRASCPASGI
jgi:hypothetical protein